MRKEKETRYAVLSLIRGAGKDKTVIKAYLKAIKRP
jgi:hypothetical protein